jgi:TolA-binding protein
MPRRAALLLPTLLCVAATGTATASPTRLTVADPFSTVRDAVQREAWDEVREGLGEKNGAPPPLVSAPGLYGRALEASGERERACMLYARDAREHSERAEAANLRFARCAQARGLRKEAVAAWLEVLAGPVLGRDLLITDEAVAALTALEHGAEAADTARFLGADKRPAPRKDTLRREALARTLLALVPHARAADARRALLLRLYLELGDTPAGREALEHADAKDLKAHKDRALAVARAEALTARHDNAAIFATLKPHAPGASELDEQACLIRVLLGKAARKLRRYKTARSNLDVAATKCGGDPQRRARYLAAQVAYYQGAGDALSLLSQFAASFPDSNLTDDALFWKAELLERAGKRDEAEATYREVGERFVDGDMREDARFNHAFSRALRGDPDGARAILDEIARTAKSQKVIERDRALYWRARLLLYPDPHKLTPTSDKARASEGRTQLVAFASARPASWYGHLARLLTLREGDAQRATLDAARAARRGQLDDSHALPVGARLEGSAAFALALQLAGAGYDPEAELLLDGIDAHALGDDERLVLTLLYSQVGGLPKSHQVMRFTGHALPPGKPTKASLLTWHLAFPRAHADALTAGARAVKKVPPTLLMGLAREESAFDADVVSWAGAIGLCQLMPFTAKEEADIVKVKLGSMDELREATLNARLGANHLSRRMKLGHPLLAIAAYNAGPGNVAKWRKPKDPKPIDAWVESIPVEQTRNYVKKVTGSWVVYESLDGDPSTVTFPFLLP